MLAGSVSLLFEILAYAVAIPMDISDVYAYDGRNIQVIGDFRVCLSFASDRHVAAHHANFL
jgi:predicted fused transcriptional regulator/phosphomethylpyrimidine kinase